MKMSTIKEEITRARYFVNEELYDFVESGNMSDTRG
jgi:hypothetical protein